MAEKEIDVIIMSGQSNMSGRGGVQAKQLEDGSFCKEWDKVVPPECEATKGTILRLTAGHDWEEAHEPLHEDIDTGMEGSGVHGILFDASLLFNEGASGHMQVASEVERFLLRLCFSNLHTGILFSKIKPEFLPEEESLFRRIAPCDGFHRQQLDNSDLGCSLNKITTAWAVSAKSCIFLTKQLNEDLRTELTCQGWAICLLSDDTDLNSLRNDFTIKRLDDFPSQIAKLNKEALGRKVTIVGYTMKWSRERDFLKRHAFPLFPTESGLSFFAINLESSLEQQLEPADMVLQKPTDEIVGISLEESYEFIGGLRFSEGMQELTRYLEEHRNVCVVDPLEKLFPLLDRAATQTILQGISEVVILGHPRVRAPNFLKVSNLGDPGLYDALEAANVVLPTIVKSQLACGIFDAHTMAVVFRKEGYIDLEVPIPCTIQEYVDHGSVQYKFYVIGDEVFYSIRRSTPNAVLLANPSGDLMEQPAAIVFHSLKSLPVQVDADNVVVRDVSPFPNGCQELDMEIMNKTAVWLRKKLSLTIFGFDVVVQLATGDYVIVDVNYFPSFKEILSDKAIPALWNALKNRITNQSTP